MKLVAAIRAAAHDSPPPAIDGLVAAQSDMAAHGALESELRMAHLLGQCAHESLRFTKVVESLSYSTADRIFVVFRRHFRDLAHAERFVRNPQKLANHVYANRNGNGPPSSGDGFRFRGRGYLQLTGRSNYARFGDRLGIGLVDAPDRATEPGIAWQIAAAYLGTRKKQGKTAFEWADQNNVEAVTLIVNGGTNGFEDRRSRTARALSALRGIRVLPRLKRGAEGDDVELLQRALAAKGFSPGALDGDFGSNTVEAVKTLQAAAGLRADGVVGHDTWIELKPFPS
jgi:putative chitinase